MANESKTPDSGDRAPEKERFPGQPQFSDSPSDDTDLNFQSKHHTLGPNRYQATPGSHRHIVGTIQEGFISETLFDPDTDIVNGSYSGTAFEQLLAILESYGLTVDVTKIVGSGNWKWTDALSGAPAVGYVGGDAALLENCTVIRINKTSTSGAQFTGANLQSGDLFVVLGTTAGAGFEIVTITDNGTWLFVEVNWTRGTGNPVDQEVMTVAFYPGASGHLHNQYLEPSEVLPGTGISVVEAPPGSVVITNTLPMDPAHGNLTGLLNNDHPQYLEPVEVKAGTGIVVDVPGDGTVIISGVSTNTAEWSFDTSTVMADPGSGDIRQNATNTAIAISVITNNSVDVTNFLIILQAGDLIAVQDTSNSNNFSRYTISAAPINNTTWFQFPVTRTSFGGVPVGNNQPVSVTFTHSGGGGGGGTGTDETFYQPTAPATPAVADIWVDSDGIATTPSLVSNIPVGGIINYAGPSVPPEFLLCDGSSKSRTTYAQLFAIVGITYGNVNGSTFNVPNLISKFARGATSPGATGGADTHNHTQASTGSSNGANTTTGSTNSAPSGTSTSGDHSHGNAAAGSHNHNITTQSDHGHGSTGVESGSIGTSGGGTGVTKSHSHSTSQAGSHSHGGSTGNESNHNHGPTGTTGNHSHSISGSNHDHGIGGISHAHTTPATDNATAGALPSYLSLLPIIYAGV